MNSRLSPKQLERLAVTVHIPPTLRTYTQGQDEVVIEGADLGAILRRLDEAFPGIRERVVDETGSPRPYVNLFVNEELVREPLAQVPLSSGDVVHILPSVAGGSLG
jgi:molybdopterin converting factor small subunit